MTNEIKTDHLSLEQFPSTQGMIKGVTFKKNKLITHYILRFKKEILKIALECFLAFRKTIGLTHSLYYQWPLNFSPVN